jgi:hypothetical protein
MIHEWKFGDWGRENSTGAMVRFVAMQQSNGHTIWLFRDGSTGVNRTCTYLPDCDGWFWEPPQPSGPQYRPFANAAEFKGHRDRWWRYKINSKYGHMLTRPPVCYSEVSHDGRSWEFRFLECEFADGSPFGVLIEDNK